MQRYLLCPEDDKKVFNIAAAMMARAVGSLGTPADGDHVAHTCTWQYDGVRMTFCQRVCLRAETRRLGQGAAF
jgi:hypothetical protein